jgi:hypothetical protein
MTKETLDEADAYAAAGLTRAHGVESAGRVSSLNSRDGQPDQA